MIAITIVFNDTGGDRFVGDRSICSSAGPSGPGNGFTVYIRHYKISTLLPLDAICITTNYVVIGVCFETFIQKGTVLPQK